MSRQNREPFPDDRRFQVERVFSFIGPMPVVDGLGVNISSTGTMTPNEAREHARKVVEAAAFAEREWATNAEAWR